VNELDAQLTAVGDALQRSWRADLAPRRQARRIVGVAVALLAVCAGVAAGASLLKSPTEERASILAGTALFQGTDPTCIAQSSVEFRCTLPSTPTGETFYDAAGHIVTDVFLGMKEETVDTSHHVDGGCISRTADGTIWDCFLGQAAVDQGVIDPAILGGYLPGPAAA
jgi:hypothetical protein